MNHAAIGVHNERMGTVDSHGYNLNMPGKTEVHTIMLAAYVLKNLSPSPVNIIMSSIQYGLFNSRVP